MHVTLVGLHQGVQVGHQLVTKHHRMRSILHQLDLRRLDTCLGCALHGDLSRGHVDGDDVLSLFVADGDYLLIVVQRNH